MNSAYFMSAFANRIKRNMCKVLFFICPTSYVLLFLSFLYFLWLGNFPISGTNIFAAIRMYSFLIFNCIIIHTWGILSNKKNSLVRELDPKRFFLDDQKINSVYHGIYRKFFFLEKPYIFKGRKPREWFIKSLYLIIWIAMVHYIIRCIDRLGYYHLNLLTFEGNKLSLEISVDTILWCLFVFGMFLNYFSCFTSLIFCKFLYELALNFNSLPFKYEKPSSTTEFQKLRSLALTIASCFSIISILYLLLLGITIYFSDPITPANARYFYELMLCAVLPCFIAIVTVCFVPLYFLHCLHSRWKQKASQELDRIDSTDPSKEGKIRRQKLREHLCEDVLPKANVECIFAGVSLLIDCLSLYMGLCAH